MAGQRFSEVTRLHADQIADLPHALRRLSLLVTFDAIRRAAEILKSGGSLVSTLYTADEGWFAERQITAHNIASSANPLSSPQGLNEVARMIADGTITARIRSTVELDGAGQMLEKLRNGGLRGAVICL